jgi:hypothetical protein
MIRLDKQLWLYGEAAYHKVFERGDVRENTWYSGTVGFRFGF